ncbi:hypothetical protein PINS_up013525 [Pythium insidiosum]|nr:hypothetical protein PINS_up013525 [Pythium insidiosum]
MQRWRRIARSEYQRAVEHAMVESHQQEIIERMDGVATHHANHRIRLGRLRRVWHEWRSSASSTTVKRRQLRRVWVLLTKRRIATAWRTWRERTALDRLKAAMQRQETTAIAEAVQTTEHSLAEMAQRTQEEHTRTVETLQQQLAQLREQISRLQDEQRTEMDRRRESDVALQGQRLQILQQALQEEVVQADDRLARVTRRLEELLQHHDVDPAGARFGAASFLVEEMVEQKINNSNAFVSIQEAFMQALDSSHGRFRGHENGSLELGKPSVEAFPLDKHSKYLCDMLHQRFKRLHQLHHAIGKLAATPPSAKGTAATDAAKLRHAVFLVDLMHDRARNHIDSLLRQHANLPKHQHDSPDLIHSTDAARSY